MINELMEEIDDQNAFGPVSSCSSNKLADFARFPRHKRRTNKRSCIHFLSPFHARRLFKLDNSNFLGIGF